MSTKQKQTQQTLHLTNEISQAIVKALMYVHKEFVPESSDGNRFLGDILFSAIVKQVVVDNPEIVKDISSKLKEKMPELIQEVGQEIVVTGLAEILKKHRYD